MVFWITVHRITKEGQVGKESMAIKLFMLITQEIDLYLNKSPRTFGYLKNTWSIRLLAAYLSSLLGINVNPTQIWRIVYDLGIVYKQPKLELEKEKGDDYEQKKGKIDGYKKISSALLKKDTAGV